MVQFFKIASWDRLFILLGLYALMQAPFLLFGNVVQVPEILWIRLGERMADGWKLYVHIADETGPLPALAYALLAKLNLANFTILRYIGSGLILMQAFLLNGICQRYLLFNDRHYLVALCYLILCHTGPDSVSLSPVLFASTFLILAYGQIFKIIKDGAVADEAMYLGLQLGLATLCYQPTALFILPFYLSALFFSGLRLNHYLLILVAMCLPISGAYAFYLIGGGEADFWRCFFAPFRIGSFVSLTGWEFLFGFGGFLLLVALIGWVVANQNSRVNFQRLSFTVFFFGLIASGLTIFLGTLQTTSQLLLIVPQAAFFLGQYLQYARSGFARELLFLLVMLVMLGGFFGMANPQFGKQIMGHSLFLEDPPKGFVANFKSQPILLLSNDFRYYKYNRPATRYFKFYLSDIRPKDSQTFEGLIYWYQTLAEDNPKLIYDPQGLMPPLAVRIPEFGKCYKGLFYPGLYQRLPGKRFGSMKE